MNEFTLEELYAAIAQFMGYYQPEEFSENRLFSFQVYFSKAECQEDFPDEVIKTYYGNDIEEFTFMDSPWDKKSLDDLLPCLTKLMQETANASGIGASHDFSIGASSMYPPGVIISRASARNGAPIAFSVKPVDGENAFYNSVFELCAGFALSKVSPDSFKPYLIIKKDD